MYLGDMLFVIEIRCSVIGGLHQARFLPAQDGLSVILMVTMDNAYFRARG